MSCHSSLHDVLTLAEIQSLADAKTVARGKAYFHEGAVSRLEERDGVVRLRSAFVSRPNEHGEGQTKDLVAEDQWDFVASSFIELADIMLGADRS